MKNMKEQKKLSIAVNIKLFRHKKFYKDEGENPRAERMKGGGVGGGKGGSKALFLDTTKEPERQDRRMRERRRRQPFPLRLMSEI